MPRKARIDAPGALHHIIIRGIERRPIFKDSLDYERFLKRLGNLLTETSTSCYAWTQMTNHAHLLLRTGLLPISTLMRRLLTGYALYFNRQHRRHGHLFQNRYKSILCEEDAYVLELVRYIHLNPIRGGIVPDMDGLKRYPRSGHAVIMGRVRMEWQNTGYVLRLFGETVRAARAAYSDFVSQGIALGRRPDLVGGGLIRSVGGWSALRDKRSADLRVMSDERILGSSEFVRKVLNQANEAYEKGTWARMKGMDLEFLIRRVADHFGIAPDLITSSVKQPSASRARGIVCHLAIDRLRVSGAAVARKLSLSPSAVSKLAGRGRSEPLSQEIERGLFD
jgi:REP element-mobilizing transposase RayT